MCGGGSVPPPPPPSAAEESLNKEYLTLLQDSRRQRDALAPLIASEAGYNPSYAANPEREKFKADLDYALSRMPEVQEKGRISWDGTTWNRDQWASHVQDLQKRFEEAPEQILSGYAPTDELKASQARAKGLQEKVDLATERELELFNMRADRQKLALEGKLPISEGTTQAKQQQFQQLKETLARAGNPIIGDTPETAYSLTTPGSQALAEFTKRFGLLEDAERRGEIESGTAALGSMLGISAGVGGSRAAGANTAAPTAGALLGTSGSLLSGYLQGQQPYANQRGLQYQGTMQNAAMAAQERAGIMNLAGTTLGSGAALYALSTKKAKKNIRKLTDAEERSSTKKLAKVKLYEWNYKDEPDDVKPHIGVVTEEAPDEVLASDGKHLDVTSYLGVLTGAVKELNREVRLLRRA